MENVFSQKFRDFEFLILSFIYFPFSIGLFLGQSHRFAFESICRWRVVGS